MSPTVSVITACYNAERYVEDSIDSVLRQSFRDLELILIDDSSSDATPDLISQAATRDPRVQVIHLTANAGPAVARNRGIEAARGQWVAILDADDIAMPDRLACQLSFAARHLELSLIGGGMTIMNEAGVDIGCSRFGELDHDRIYTRLVAMDAFFPHSSWLVRHAVLQRLGGYDAFFRKAHDYELLLRICEVARVGCMEDCVVRLRKHEGSLSHDSDFMQYRFGLTGLVEHRRRIGNLACGSGKQQTFDAVAQWFADLDLPRRMLAQRHFRFAWNHLRSANLLESTRSLARAFSTDPTFPMSRRKLRRLQANPFQTLCRYL